MSIAKIYPNLHQWLSHYGRMLVQPSKDGGIQVQIGDPGGFPQSKPAHGSTLDEALAEAESAAGQWLDSTKKLQQDLLTNDWPEFRSREFISVTGWPLARNPFYRKEND